MYKFKEIRINCSAHKRLKELSHLLNIPICELVDLLVTSFNEENNGTK